MEEVGTSMSWIDADRSRNAPTLGRDERRSSRGFRQSSTRVSYYVVGYVALWILEGAVRKWVPGTQGLLYVLRDVYLIAILFRFSYTRVLTRSQLLKMVIVCCPVVFFALMQYAVLNLSTQVLLIGLRSYLSPCLAILLIGYVSSLQTIRVVARSILFFVPVQLILMLVQVMSSPSASVNREVVSDAASFVNGDVVRPSGTFSSPMGLTLYISLVAACIFVTKMGRVSQLLSTLCVVLMVLLSGSRGAVLSTSLIYGACLWWSVCSSSSSRRWSWTQQFLTGSAVLILFAKLMPSVTGSFEERFVTASQSEDSLGRIVHQTLGFLNNAASPLGAGIGVNSQAGIAAGSGGEWVEVDSIKWVSELGWLGLALAILRLGLGIWIILQILFEARNRDIGVIALLSAFGQVVLYGPITQSPTTQGFAGVCGGLLFCLWRLERTGPRYELKRSTSHLSLPKSASGSL